MRAVIFGVDGLSFRVLHPLIQRGDLPNFARLQREGVEADFISCVPAVTPPGLDVACDGIETCQAWRLRLLGI